MKFYQKSVSLMALLALLSSCGMVRSERINKKTNKVVTGLGSLEEPTAKTFSAGELTVAARLCLALKAKRTNLEASPGTSAYIFNLEKRNCKNKLEETKRFSANIIGVGRDLEYVTREVGTYFTDVITDQHEALSDLCSLLGATPDAKNVANILAINDKIYTITFTQNAQSYDTVNFLVRTKNKEGAYVLTRGESISIATNPSQLGTKFLGVEKERSQYSACSGTDVRSLKETWLAPGIYNL